MHIAFALPEPAETGIGGGAEYVHALVAALRDLGHTVDVLIGPMPHFPAGARQVVDGMLLPRLHASLVTLVTDDALALVHHVSAAAGRDESARKQVRAVEAEMLPRLRRVVATSAPVAERLQSEFGIVAHIVEPGAHDRPRNIIDLNAPCILAVGVLTRRKRHDQLLRIAARLIDLPWHLVIAGDADREPAHAAELAALIVELGLSKRVELLANPAAAELERAWCSATVFALATRWEGYPAAIAEALRRGIPVVTTIEGDPACLVRPDAGATIALDDAATFGKCLRRLLCDPDLYRDMAEAAWRAGQSLPSWHQRARAFAAILET